MAWLYYGIGAVVGFVLLGKFLIGKMKKMMHAIEPGTKTPPGVLCCDALDQLVDKLELTEVKNHPGKSWMDMHVKDLFNHTIMGEDLVGEVRVFVGEKISKLVYCRMTVHWMGMDSHMIFAFTKNNSPVPHFTLDSVRAPKGVNAFHLDMITRVDLGAHLKYMDYFYSPLSETAEKVMSMEGKTAANLTLRQMAVMSPWMGFGRLETKSYEEFKVHVQTYLDHWLDRLNTVNDGGLPAEIAEEIADCDLEGRSAANRKMIFNRDVDPVWAQIDRVVGMEVSEKIRLICEKPDMGVPPKYL